VSVTAVAFQSQSRSFARPSDHRPHSPHHRGRVLLVEDDVDQAAILEAVLRHEGLDVSVAPSAEQALELHQRNAVDVLVTDLKLPGMTGVELMRRLVPVPGGEEPKAPPPAVIVVTGAATIGTAIEALKLGAADYLQKPLDPARLVSLIHELMSSDNVREVEGDEDDPTGSLVFEGMIGGSRAMREVFARIDRVAATSAPVLIVGESGTGKELVARGVHNRSRRKNGPFVPVHTGAIPRELIGSELFGHEKGSFTGAFSAAEGKFEAAAGGTVFLDEVGTMDTAVQVSLLRVLETYRFTRVGGRKEIEADVRIVAATNKDLLDLVDENVFREDLYYRLNVFTITLPPLRERQEDIVPIAERFLVKYAKRYGTAARSLSQGAVDRLMAHEWPGNVRELRNVVEQTPLFASSEVVAADEVQLGQGRIEKRGGRRIAEPAVAVPTAETPMTPPAAELLAEREPTAGSEAPEGEADARSSWVPATTTPLPIPSPSPSTPPETAVYTPPPPAPAVTPSSPPPAAAATDTGDDEHPLVLRLPVGTRLADAERKLILMTLEAVRGNKQRAARVLGISRRGLYSKLQAYGEHVAASAEVEVTETPDTDAADAIDVVDVESTSDETPIGVEAPTQGA
jgi:DNA-binding NtrC family response regulator